MSFLGGRRSVLLTLGAASAALAFLFLFPVSSAAPLPPLSGDWTIDPAEVVYINQTNVTVEGNITLGAGSQLHFFESGLIFNEGAAKRVLTAPASSRVTFTSSRISAAVGVGAGGKGYYLRCEGALTIEFSFVSGLSGPLIPNPLVETEGIHIAGPGSSIRNSTISGAQGYAVTVTPLGATVTPAIEDNTIQNSGGGILLAGFLIFRADALVARNTFTLNALPHVAVTGSNPLIENNSFFGSTAGAVVLFGSPTIRGNLFVGNALNAVSVVTGGGLIESNVVTGSGVAFQFVSSTVTLRGNSVSFSISALSADGSSVTAINNTFSSAAGASAVTATNSSTLLIQGGTVSAPSGAGIVVTGGRLVVENATVTASLSAVSASGASVVLNDSTFRGAGLAPALSLRAGSLDLAGGLVESGTDGVLLDNATGQISGATLRGNAGWGIRSIHKTPSLSADEITRFVFSNSLGDLLVESDLAVEVFDDGGAPVANATVTITPASPGETVSGLTGDDGTVGPVRLTAIKVDSLNNRRDLAPYAVRGAFETVYRGNATAILLEDERVTVRLARNHPPSVSLGPLANALAAEPYTLRAGVLDTDGDEIAYRWTTDDGQSSAASEPIFTFFGQGTVRVTVNVSDGFESSEANATLLVVSTVPANRPPVFTTEPRTDANLRERYTYPLIVNDPEGDPVIFQLADAPQGMTLSQEGSAPFALVTWIPLLYHPRTAEAYNLTFNVSILVWDGHNFAFQNFTVLLRNPPDVPPEIRSFVILPVPVGELVVVDLAPLAFDGDDLDTSTLRWSVRLPEDLAGATIGFDPRNSSRLLIRGPPSLDAPRTLLLTFVLTDPTGLSDEETVPVVLEAGAPSGGIATWTLLVPSLLAAAAVGIAIWLVEVARRKERAP